MLKPAEFKIKRFLLTKTAHNKNKMAFYEASFMAFNTNQLLRRFDDGALMIMLFTKVLPDSSYVIDFLL